MMSGSPRSVPAFIAWIASRKATDHAAAAAFATEKMGFTLAHTGEDGTTYLKANGGIDPYSLVYSPGDGPGLHYVSYLVKDATALDQAAALLGSKDVAFTRVDK